MATYVSKGDRFQDGTVPPRAIGTIARPSSNTGLSDFWSNCPLAAVMLDPAVGYGIQDNFIDMGLTGTVGAVASHTGTGRYLLFGDAGSTIVPDAALGGGLALTNDTTDDDQVSIATKQQPFQIVNTAGDLWFECRAKVSSIVTEVAGFAIGLMGITAQSTIVPMVTNTGVLANIDFVGFNKLNASTTAFNAVYKNIGQTEAATATDAGALGVTYVKYGFRYNNGSLNFYVDGVLLDTITSTEVDASTFPNNVTLRLIASVMNGTSAASILTLDWWKCFQVR